jgi:hypothetical protein
MTWTDIAQALVMLAGGVLILTTALLVFVTMTDRMDRDDG